MPPNDNQSYDWIQQTPKAREAVTPQTQAAIKQAVPQVVVCPMCGGSGQIRAMPNQPPAQGKQPKQQPAQQQQAQQYSHVMDPVPAGRGFGQLFDKDGRPI